MLLMTVLINSGTGGNTYADEPPAQGQSSVLITPSNSELKPEFLEKNNTSQYQIGDRIQFSAVLPYEISIRLRNFKLKAIPTGESEAKDSGLYIDPSPQVINGSIRFSISPLKPGKLTTPALQVVENETTVIAKIQSVQIDVAELKQDSTGQPQLLDAEALPIPLRFVFLGLLILALVSYMGLLIYRRYFKKPPAVPVVNDVKIPPVPDHEIALRELNTLFEQYSFSGPNLKPVSFGVSQILKNFFSARFRIEARESTTEEMIALLRAETLPEQEVRRIILLFRDLDQIKFTDYEHHSHYQKTDYTGFRDTARIVIESWTIRGSNR